MPNEDDLRAAFRSLAAQAPAAASVLTAVRQSPPPRAFSPRGRWPLIRRLLIPFSAAAAIVAVVACVTAIAGRTHDRGAGASARQLLRRAPRYYLELVGDSVNGPYHAIIRDTVTGATLAAAWPPRPFWSFSAVAGGSDDRTFVLAAQRHDEPAPVAQRKLFIARFNPADGRLIISALPIPEFPMQVTVTGIALSPGAGTLAVALGTGRRQTQAQIRVYSLLTGAVRVWQAPGFVGAPDVANSITWGPAGILAVNYLDSLPGSISVRLLNTRTAGGSLLADSRLVICSKQPGGFQFSGNGVLTPDGKKIVAPAWRLNGWKSAAPPCTPGAAGARSRLNSAALGSALTSEYREFSAASGRPTGILYRTRTMNYSVLWASSSGSVLVVEARRPGAPKSALNPVYGVVAGQRFVPVRRSPAGSVATAMAAF
jgi:hypothetical protein